MSIINMFGGVWNARKVAAKAFGLWKDTINYMLHSGRTPDLSVSRYYLAEAYSLCVFVNGCRNSKRHNDRFGAIIVETSRLVGEYAKTVWSEQLPTKQAEEIASEMAASLPDYYGEWQDRALDAMTRTKTSDKGTLGAHVQTGIGVFVLDVASWSSNEERPLWPAVPRGQCSVKEMLDLQAIASGHLD